VGERAGDNLDTGSD